MDSHLFPFLADGLIDGGPLVESAPPDFRVTVDVLRTAREPGSAGELGAMAARVQQFLAEVCLSPVASTPYIHPQRR